MIDDAYFLDLVRADPGDRDARSSYADWLEGQGELQRARLLRVHLELWSAAKATKRQRSALLALGKGLPGDWLAATAYPRLLDTSWIGLNGTEIGTFILRFLPGGDFDYVQKEDITEGTWRQVGNIVYIDVNSYSQREGIIVGDEISGTVSNIAGMKWRWSASLLDDH